MNQIDFAVDSGAPTTRDAERSWEEKSFAATETVWSDGPQQDQLGQDSLGINFVLGSDDDFLVQFVVAKLPRSLRHTIETADIVQTVRLRVWQNRLQFRGRTSQQFRVWVLQIARHHMMDLLRQLRLKRLHQAAFGNEHSVVEQCNPAEEKFSPLPTAIRHEQRKLLSAAMTSLPPTIRRIICLRFINEWTFLRIAAETKLPVTTCRRQCEHGCQVLRRRLSSPGRSS